MRNKVVCDKCTKEFEIKLKTKKHINTVEEVFFKCPNCGEKHISYFTDKNIRLKQKKINKMWEEYRNIATQKEIINIELLTKIDDIQAEIKEDMKELRMKMLGAH